MGKGLGWLLPVAAVAATVLTGGAAAPAIAGAAGAGAAGAGAATGAGLLGSGAVGTAGGALAAQGAAGLLGGAGAAAAGYGAAGAGAAGLAGAAASDLPAGMAAYGPHGEYTGATIANDGMAANSFTGGYDALNPLQRGMQRLGSMDLNSNGMKLANKGMGMMQQGQQPQGPQNVSSNMQAAPRQQMPQGSFMSSANNIDNMTEEELKRRSWLQNLGNPNA